MTLPESFRCYLVRKLAADRIEAGVEQRPLRELPAGDVLIRVACSSLNYKDAMAATGHAGIVRKFPHVPGIDIAGIVVESGTARFRPGDQVIATGHAIGVDRWGGWAEYARVPAEFVLPLPSGLTLEEAMILGTAGFTAAQCVLALQHHGIAPGSGDLVVTGTTGGVGCLALQILAKLGYSVVAVSGKTDRHDWLRHLGAAWVAGREELLDETSRPLLSAKYAGGVDTVGGRMLATLVRQVGHRGCVAMCGVVGGAELPLTVYPFILRGVTLAGIDSAWCPEERRAEIWRLLAGEWKPSELAGIATWVDLGGLDAAVQQILKGGVVGRVVVRI